MRYRTLDKNWQFNRVYGRGKSYVHPHCVLYVAKNRLGYTRIGLTATKKVGHAVQRNRARRVMRAALSEHPTRPPRPPCPRRPRNDRPPSHRAFARLQKIYQSAPRASLPVHTHLQ